MSDAFLMDAITKVLKAEHPKERVLAKQEAQKAAKELNGRLRSMNGLGRQRLQIPLYAYNYWGQRLGYQCWKDKKFLDEFERDNPECRVDSGGTKEIHVGWQPSSDRVKFHKQYA